MPAARFRLPALKLDDVGSGCVRSGCVGSGCDNVDVGKSLCDRVLLLVPVLGAVSTVGDGAVPAVSRSVGDGCTASPRPASRLLLRFDDEDAEDEDDGGGAAGAAAAAAGERRRSVPGCDDDRSRVTIASSSSSSSSRWVPVPPPPSSSSFDNVIVVAGASASAGVATCVPGVRWLLLLLRVDVDFKKAADAA
jgi:hypothetical protein